MKLSGVARLVPGNFWVGSTPAQSLRGGGEGGSASEFAVVVGCIFFSLHFSQSKNALLLNYVHPTF